MSSAGHIMDMITRMKNNEALKKGKREQRRKLNELFQQDNLHADNNQIRESEISVEDLEVVKAKIHTTSVKERRIGIVFTLMITTFIILAIIAIVYWGFVK